METHDLTTKMIAKIPKIARNCESWAKTARFIHHFYELSKPETGNDLGFLEVEYKKI
jgi:hypothetical protein